MAFQVFSQVCSAVIERLEASRAAETQRLAAELQLSLVRHARDSDDLLGSLTRQLQEVSQLLPSDGAAVMLGGRLSCIGDGLPEDFVRRVVQQLELDDSLETFHTEKWPHPLPQLPEARFCGVLAIRFHRQASGWILWFRLEEVQTINWGGKPEKILSVGPSGARLTPRGSFEAWEEVVSGRSAVWGPTDLNIAEKLRIELMELCLNRASEIDRMRQRLIAVLGHDLRNPLQSISMAAAMLSPNDTRTAELRQHITNSSGRMERLISQILEMSRLQAGAGITLQRVPTDLSRLVGEIISETGLAYPGLNMETAITPGVMVDADPDRMAQVVANLLSNARHHGTQGRPVLVSLSQDDSHAILSILNEAEVLSEERLASLFTPFKQHLPEHGRNKSGLGIGLYISQAIVLAHGGTIEVTQGDGIITFKVRMAR
nr:ATP-binding protein [Pseudomonas sp. RIT-PI-AD]